MQGSKIDMGMIGHIRNISQNSNKSNENDNIGLPRVGTLQTVESTT